VSRGKSSGSRANSASRKKSSISRSSRAKR
jgi:hypothetical protein